MKVKSGVRVFAIDCAQGAAVFVALLALGFVCHAVVVVFTWGWRLIP
jgi:hypothetical protein